MSRITFRQYARMLVGKPLRGSVSDANSWAWIIGPLGIGGLTSLGLGRMINVDHLSPVQNGLLYFAATLALAYLIRLLIWAPYERYRELDAKNRELAAPPSDLELRKVAAAEAQAAAMERTNQMAEMNTGTAGDILWDMQERRRAVLTEARAPVEPPHKKTIGK